MIGKVIYDLLSNDVTVSGLVSARIYPDTVPQNAEFPYIAYTVTSTTPTDAKDGASELDTVSFQVDCYAREYATAQTIAEGVRAALDRYTGTNNSVVVDKIIFSNQGSGTFEPRTGIFWATQDYNARIKR